MASRRPTVSSDAADRVGDYVVSIGASHPGTLTIGLCGAQGSGKSTVAAAVQARLAAAGRSVAVLSLDDLYLPREERDALSRRIHPLLRTRGVPGTHDVALGERVLDGLCRAGCVATPRFDKALDTPEPAGRWPMINGPVDVILFEGWCVGARPEGPAALRRPINALERTCDPTGEWRGYVNQSLAGSYQRLFARLDRLVLLAAPSFDVVGVWRGQQEDALRERLQAEGRNFELSMDDAAVERFIQHYERLSRHILREMPARADLLLRLDPLRRVVGESRLEQ